MQCVSVIHNWQWWLENDWPSMYITGFLAWLHVTYRHLKPQWCNFNHGSSMSQTGTNFHLLGGHWTMKLWKRVLHKIYLTLSNFIPHGIHLNRLNDFNEFFTLITITTTCKQLAMTWTHNDGTYNDKLYVTKFLDEGRYLSLHQIITASG